MEVGSHNINDSPRKYFWFNKSYTGIDISEGKGVDRVGEFNKMSFDRKFGVVVSTEMLEHDINWRESLAKMYDLLEVGGLLLITCASSDRSEHGTKRTTPHCSPDTTDYYRNISTEDFKSILSEWMFEHYVLQTARGLNDLQFYGIKQKQERVISIPSGYLKAKWSYQKLMEGNKA